MFACSQIAINLTADAIAACVSPPDGVRSDGVAWTVSDGVPRWGRVQLWREHEMSPQERGARARF